MRERKGERRKGGRRGRREGGRKAIKKKRDERRRELEEREGGRKGRKGGREEGSILQSPGHRAYLNVIDRVNVLHGVLHHLAHLLQPSVGPQGGHSAPLHQHIALRQQLHCL